MPVIRRSKMRSIPESIELPDVSEESEASKVIFHNEPCCDCVGCGTLEKCDCKCGCHEEMVNVSLGEGKIHNKDYLLFVADVPYGKKHKILEQYAHVVQYDEKLFMNRTLKDFSESGDDKCNCILYFNIRVKSARDYLQENLNLSHPYQLIILYDKSISAKISKDEWAREMSEAYHATVIKMSTFIKSASKALSWEDFVKKIQQFGDKIKAPKGLMKTLAKIFFCGCGK